MKLSKQNLRQFAVMIIIIFISLNGKVPVLYGQCTIIHVICNFSCYLLLIHFIDMLSTDCKSEKKCIEWKKNKQTMPCQVLLCRPFFHLTEVKFKPRFSFMNHKGFVREPYSFVPLACTSLVLLLRFTRPEVHMISGSTVYVSSQIPVLMPHRCAAFSQVMYCT